MEPALDIPPVAPAAASDLVEGLAAFLSAPLAPVVAAVFGALWGSFFNVCIARIPIGKSVVRPGSHCFACGRPVRARDNVPVLSYLLLRGRCRDCGARFSVRYMLVELLSAALSLAVFQVFVAGRPELAIGVRVASYFCYFAFAGLLLVLSFIDLDTKRLPDVLTLPAIPVFFLAGFGTHLVPWSERAIGAIGGYLVIRVVSDGYFYLRGREGLGLGDAKLLAVIGATLGWKALPAIVFFASLLGVLVGVPALLWARRADAPRTTSSGSAGEPPPGPEPDEAAPPSTGDAVDEPTDPRLRFAQVPFGPFLALGALAFLLLADRVWPALMRLLGG